MGDLFFDDKEDKRFALERLATLQYGENEPALEKLDKCNFILNPVYNIAKEQDDEQKLAQNLSQRFKKDNKSTGALGENILEFFKRYDEEACRDHSLLEGQQIK